MTISGATYREGIAFSPDGAMYVTPTGTASITGGTIGPGVAGVPYNVLSTAIPFISVATGSMGNNGAMTVGTALDATYSDGAYYLVPAGAIAVGVPAAAAWYYGVASTTTAVTLFNNVYTSGAPTIPAAPTAFATTGPGAFTGVTAATDSIVVTIPAGSMGVQGFIYYELLIDANNTGNAKTAASKYGVTTFASHPNTSTLSAHHAGIIMNRGMANRQVGGAAGTTGGWGNSAGTNTVRGSNDSATALSFAITTTKATATDNLIISGLRVDVTYRP